MAFFMETTGGWIKLYRDIQDDDMYFSQPFTRMAAWIDILLICNHDLKVIFVRGNRVEINRGQFAYGEETLARRWAWSRKKVRSFLDLLEKKGKIGQQKSRILSLYTVLSYDKYQSKCTAECTTEEQQKIQQKNINKNDKNEKKKEKSPETVDTSVLQAGSPTPNAAPPPSSKTGLVACTQEELVEIRDKYHVSSRDVIFTHDTIMDKIATNQFKYKTVYHTLANWIRMGIQRGTITQIQ